MLFAPISSAQAINQAGKQALELKNQTLFYAVTYQKFRAGKLEIVIERDEKQIKTTVISHLSNFAKLFLDNTTIETWFNIKNHQVALHRGHYLIDDKKTVKRSFVIDCQQAQIKLQPKDKHISIDTTDILEPASFPIILMTSDLQAIAGRTVQEITSKGINEYVYLAPQQQSLELDGKKFEAWKVTRQQPTNPTRTVTVWLDRNNQQIPLKIVSSRKGKGTVMTLLSQS